MQGLAPQGFLQTCRDKPGDFLFHHQWCFARDLVKVPGPIHRFGCRLFTAHNLDQWQQIRRVKRVAYDRAFWRRAIGLNVAHRQPRGGGANDH